MKKLISLLIMAAMLISLTACTSKEVAQTTTTAGGASAQVTTVADNNSNSDWIKAPTGSTVFNFDRTKNALVGFYDYADNLVDHDVPLTADELETNSTLLKVHVVGDSIIMENGKIGDEQVLKFGNNETYFPYLVTPVMIDEVFVINADENSLKTGDIIYVLNNRYIGDSAVEKVKNNISAQNKNKEEKEALAKTELSEKEKSDLESSIERIKTTIKQQENILAAYEKVKNNGLEFMYSYPLESGKPMLIHIRNTSWQSESLGTVYKMQYAFSLSDNEFPNLLTEENMGNITDGTSAPEFHEKYKTLWESVKEKYGKYFQ